ncbi:hypothetical protein AAE478_009113 [Parahypoxylon ruwenzoriense]
MGSPQHFVSREDGSKQKYTSKYFPLDINAIPRNADEALLESLTVYATDEIYRQLRNGIGIHELWKDAYESVNGEHPSELDRQYAMIVRKLTARIIANGMFGKPDDCLSIALGFPPSALAEASRDGESASGPNTPSPSLSQPNLSKLNPQAQAFSPAPAVKDTPNPSATEPTPQRLVSFEDRCRKLGLRISSPKE